MVYGGLGGEPGAYTSVDQRGRFLESLGLQIPQTIDELATADRAYFVSISKENYRLFDTDVAVIIGSSNDSATVIAGEPLYGDLTNVQDGRAVFLDELKGAWSGAIGCNSPLSLPHALDSFIAARSGPPAATSSSCVPCSTTRPVSSTRPVSAPAGPPAARHGRGRRRLLPVSLTWPVLVRSVGWVPAGPPPQSRGQ